jgi:HEAT repeat protein
MTTALDRTPGRTLRRPARPGRLVPRLLVLTLAVVIWAGPIQASELDAASPEELIEVLKANVYLTGDIVKRMEAQKRLGSLGKQNPQAVVPLILKDLAAPRSYGKMAAHRRLALIELLRDIGPAAESAFPVLVEILDDPEEPFDAVKTQAAAALAWIGTPQAKAAAKAYYDGLSAGFAAKASDPEASRSVSQSAFLIRQELRNPEPSDGVIGASVGQLRALGPRASPALPTLFKAYNDPRLGSALRQDIATVIGSLGVADAESAARQVAESAGVPDILADVIQDTQSEDSFVRGLAMIELGRMGASAPAIDAMIEALDQGRNPGDAANVLGNFGKPARRALTELVRYFDDVDVGANAIQAVGKIGVLDPATITELRRVLGTRSHRHRGMAASVLGELRANTAVPELARTVVDGGKYDRILSANALGKMGRHAAPAVGVFAAVLADPDQDLRLAVVKALGQIGEAAAPAAEAIARQLDSGDLRLESAARVALANIGGAEANAALRKDASRFADADLAEVGRLVAVDGMKGVWSYLGQLGDGRAEPLAHRLLSDGNSDSAFVGALYLARQGVIEPAVPILADNLARRSEGKEMLTGLAYSMMHGGDEAQVRPLFEALESFIRDNRDRYSAEEWDKLERLFRQDSSTK